MKTPLVSCIMPTANREKFIQLAIEHFLKQDYPNKELIIIDDGKKSIKSLVPENPRIHYYYYNKPIGSIGLKRNCACSKSNGEIIVHFDDDDWYAPDWISAGVHFLSQSGAGICGIQHIHYYTAITNKFLTVIRQYAGANNPMNWAAGGTIAYRKSVWDKYHFIDSQIDEDDDFIKNSGAKLYVHDHIDGYVCILHPHNTMIREFEDTKYKKGVSD